MGLASKGGNFQNKFRSCVALCILVLGLLKYYNPEGSFSQSPISSHSVENRRSKSKMEISLQMHLIASVDCADNYLRVPGRRPEHGLRCRAPLEKCKHRTHPC